MAIKPIEKSSNGAVLKVATLIFLLLAGFAFSKMSESKNNESDKQQVLSIETEKKDLGKSAENLAENILYKSQDVAGQILGEASDLVENIASKSSYPLTNILIKQTIKKFIALELLYKSLVFDD